MLNGFNINSNMFSEIQQICADHFACKDCPVYNNYGLHASDNSVTMCQKTAERIVKEQRNGNNS